MQNGRWLLTKAQRGLALTWAEEPLPRPAAGEVRVKILAAGVGFSDLLRLRGMYPGDPAPPYSPGWDFVGEVDEVGAGVQGWQPGRRVAGLTGTGNFARTRTVPAGDLIAVPDGVDPAQAACLPLNYVTAYQMLHRVAQARAGETVLVQAAAGGVGSALLQLAALAGLHAYGVASTGHLETVTRLGGVAIDRNAEDFLQRLRALPGRGVDIALDPIGGDVAVRSFRALRPGGRFVSFGLGGVVNRSLGAVLFAYVWHFVRLRLWNWLPGGRRATFYSIGTQRKQHPEWIREDLALLLGWLAAGKIAPVIAERVPLREAPRALELLAAGKTQGKLILMGQE